MQVRRVMGSSYVDAGVEWLGDVPERWKALGCKFAYSIQLGKMLQNEPQSAADVKVPYLKALHVQWETVDTSELPEMWASQQDIKKFAVRSGALLVCEGGEVGRAGMLADAPDDCIIQNALHRVRAKGGNDAQYLMYLLEVAASSGWFDIICNKATIAHFTGEKFGDFLIALPPPSEQRTIAAFLDRETTRLDVLIEKKHRQIDLLQEKRAALISHAVTKGLDPDAKMKDSGIEWLGEIPMHWEVVPLFRLATTIQTGPFGSQLHSADYIEGGIPIINPVHLVANRLVPDERSTVDKSTALRLIRSGLKNLSTKVEWEGEQG